MKLFVLGRSRAFVLVFAVMFVFTLASISNAAVFRNADTSVVLPDPYVSFDGDGVSSYLVTEESRLIVLGGTRGSFDRSTIRLRDDATALIRGGNFRDFDDNSQTDVVRLEDRSQVIITGGRFTSSDVFGSSPIFATDESHAEINGGTYASEEGATVYVRRNGSVTINGGEFTTEDDNGDMIRHQGLSLVKITGGEFTSSRHLATVTQGSLEIHGGVFNSSSDDLRLIGGQTEVFVRFARLNNTFIESGEIRESSGVLDVVFIDGSTESLSFFRERGALRVTYVPEPAAASFYAVTLAVLCSRSTRSARRS